MAYGENTLCNSIVWLGVSSWEEDTCYCATGPRGGFADKCTERHSSFGKSIYIRQNEQPAHQPQVLCYAVNGQIIDSRCLADGGWASLKDGWSNTKCDLTKEGWLTRCKIRCLQDGTVFYSEVSEQHGAGKLQTCLEDPPATPPTPAVCHSCTATTRSFTCCDLDECNAFCDDLYREDPSAASLCKAGCTGMQPTVTFRLRGRSGQEQVTITVGSVVETHTLTRSFQTFSYPFPSTGLYYVNFNNDDSANDVTFSASASALKSIEFPSSWSTWKCGAADEDVRCNSVRTGKFAWSGQYTMTTAEAEATNTECCDVTV